MLRVKNNDKGYYNRSNQFYRNNLISELLKRDYFIYAVVRSNSKSINKLPISSNIKIVYLDMEKIDELHNKIDEKCNVFIHLAWDGTRGSTRDDKELQQKNYKYAMLAIEEAHKLGCDLFMGAGSQAEYGLYNCEITEFTQCNPVTEYGKEKLKVCNDGYNLCQQYGMRFKWPRFFSLYGIDDYEGTLLISTIDKMLLNQDVTLTECIQMWNFLHIKDAAKGIVKLIEKDCSDGVYNFGSNDTRQLKKFIDDLYHLTNTQSKIMYGAIPYPSTGMVSVQPNIDKMKKETQWEPVILFEDGIKEIIKNRVKMMKK